MGKVVYGLIGLVIGAVVGTMFFGALIGGTAAGIGVATGLSAGICSTVQAAVEEELLTPEQVDQVLNRAASDIAEMSSDVSARSEIVGSANDCQEVMKSLAEANS